MTGKLSTKLVISYSDTRAKKYNADREKDLRKLEKQIKVGMLTKASINDSGYNNNLKLDGEINITINKEKFEADGKRAGLRGHLTVSIRPGTC